VLLTPLVAYVAFKLLIKREDDYLANRFGRAYLDCLTCVSDGAAGWTRQSWDGSNAFATSGESPPVAYT
jgi:hypothetical protein